MGHHGEGTALSANSVSADRKARSALCYPVSPVASRVARLLPASAGLASACLLVDSVTRGGGVGLGNEAHQNSGARPLEPAFGPAAEGTERSLRTRSSSSKRSHSRRINCETFSGSVSFAACSANCCHSEPVGLSGWSFMIRLPSSIPGVRDGLFSCGSAGVGVGHYSRLDRAAKIPRPSREPCRYAHGSRTANHLQWGGSPQAFRSQEVLRTGG